MAIIKYIHQYTAPQEVLLNLYPDQFISDGIEIDKNRRPTDGNGNVLPMPRQHVTSTTKASKDWWKVNMDYFYTVALAQYNWQSTKIVRNYELLKGHLVPEDFYLEGPVMTIVDELMKDVDLPAYVKHYSIMNPVVNTMVGEKSKRPDIPFAKCVDSESMSEQNEFYTGLFNEYIEQEIRNRIVNKLQQKGVDTSHVEEFNQQVEQLTAEKMQEYMVTYTTQAEVWANNMLTWMKTEFNTKEMFESGFRDLIISNMAFYHNYEVRSKTGFKAEKVNPKNVWWLTTPDKKYIRDSYAAGIVDVMELSEIIDKFDLTDEEIEHLRDFSQQAFFPYAKLSNFYSGKTGEDSISYNNYDPAVLRERNLIETQLGASQQQRADGLFQNAAPNVGTFGNRFIVTQAYWRSKRKEGLLTYIDIDGNEQSVIVDDTYKDGQHPQQIELEWKWENQWYKGVKIGNDIYYVEPLKILDYCPIIGLVFEIENTISTSKVDEMKPYQTIANICMNQIYRMLEKEKGKGIMMNKRLLPIPRGGSYEDAKQLFETEFEETGVAWLDDSPDALKGGGLQFNQMQVIDLTLTDAIQGKFNIFMEMKNACWEFAGINKERAGAIAATQTATGTNTALSQSYAQTEPLFVAHEYVENQQLQAMLDIAQYIECNKPESTISFVDSQGGNVFCKLQTELHLKNRDIKLFMTSRADDLKFREDLKLLSQAALQNGASLYEVAMMNQEKSPKKLLDIFKKLKEKNEQLYQQKMEQEQQAQQQQGEIAQQQLQQQEKQNQDQINLEMYKTDIAADTSIRVEQMKQNLQIHKDFMSTNGPDELDYAAQGLKEQESIYKQDIEQLRIQLQTKTMQNTLNQQQAEGYRKDRKLDLEEKGLELKKQQIKQQKTKANAAK